MRQRVFSARLYAGLTSACAAVMVAQIVTAQDLSLPAAAQPLANRDMPFAPYRVPIGPWAKGAVPMRLTEGRILRRTWRVNSSQTTLQVFAPLRAQIEERGFQILYQCHDAECGGFDFRFAIDVVPAPDMAVDFGDFLFLSAQRQEGEYVTLLVSRFGRTNFVQLVEVGTEMDVAVPDAPADAAAPLAAVPQVAVEREADPIDLVSQLKRDGHVVLSGLDFQSGSPNLAGSGYDSLEKLAAFLTEDTDQRVLLVGHTDTVGGLSGNIALSKARADSVRRQLQDIYGIENSRLEAAGAGYLSPLTSNEDAAGREINRRVEVVLLPPK
ncbi:OmpA family protein [Epibacterium sp. SM1979]|uniref:OmpA family protein n=1 Tax=Tritonibacter litoralis TaxID=2662264 RepID=A0A843YKK8_9RHOB|nr:OmpA family protein [Tritonibacter litoralis]